MPVPPTPPDWPTPGAVPLGLIGGTGRSGTTALRDALGHHPAVLAFPELRFAVDPDGLVDTYRAFQSGWSPYHADVRLRRLGALLEAVADDSPLALPGRVGKKLGLDGMLGRQLTPAYHGHRAVDVCPAFRALADDLLDALTGYAYAGAWTGTPAGARAEVRVGGPYDDRALAALLGGFWRAVAADSLAHSKKRFFLDKQTWSILWFDHVLELLPEAKLVHVLRDPRDVVASYATMRWGPSDPVVAARLVADVLARWRTVKARVPADRVLEVRLEDLSADPDGQLEAICDFFGLEWNAALRLADLGRPQTGRWRRDLGPHAVDVERILSEAVEAGGYDRP